MKHAKGMFKRWLLRAGKWPWKAKKEKFHTCGGPRRRPCLGQGRGRRIIYSPHICGVPFFAGNPPRSVRRPPPAVFSVSLSTCLYHKKKVSTLLSKSLSLSHSSVLLLWKPKKCHYYEREFACWKPAAFQFKKPLPVSIFVPNVFDFVERPLDLRASHPAEI
jgi:hypothetical protein